MDYYHSTLARLEVKKISNILALKHMDKMSETKNDLDI